MGRRKNSSSDSSPHNIYIKVGMVFAIFASLLFITTLLTYDTHTPQVLGAQTTNQNTTLQFLIPLALIITLTALIIIIFALRKKNSTQSYKQIF